MEQENLILEPRRKRARVDYRVIEESEDESEEVEEEEKVIQGDS
jgi:hypothetical protein